MPHAVGAPAGPKRANARVFGVALLSLAAVVLLFTGILGSGRTSRFGDDFDLFYAAGTFWLHGQNPYELSSFMAAESQHRVYPYPPTTAPFCMLMALLPIEAAHWAMLVLNLLALAALALITVRLATHPEWPRPASRWAITPWLMAAFVVGNPFTSRTTWIGQTSVPVAAALIGGWMLARRGRDGAAAVALSITTSKPQVLPLPVLWLLLERRWRLLGLTAVLAGAFSLTPLLTGAPVATWGDWVHGLEVYQTQGDDTAGAMQVLGVASFLAKAGYPVPLAVPAAVAALLTIGLWLRRSRVLADDVLAILLVAQLGLVREHQSELVLIAPAVAMLWLHSAARPLALIVSTALLLTLQIPWRTVQKLGVPLLTHWCTPTLILLLIWMLWLSRDARTRSGPGTEAA